MSHPSPEETLQDCLEPPKTLQDELLDALLHAPEEFSHSSQLTRVEDQDTAAERDALEREQLLHSTYQDRRARQLAELPPQQRLELTRNPSLMERYGDAEIILAVQDTEALDHGLLQGEDPNYSMFVTSSPSGSPEAPAAGSDPARREAIDGIDQVHQGMCSYLKPLLSRAACTWTVLLCGELHSGKTQVAQKLFTSTDPRHAAYIPHSMDTMKEEVARGISLRMHVATVLMQTRAGKSFPLQIVDTPGHACFEEEVACAASVADVGILVVDVAEGITQGTRRCVHHIIEAQLPCILLLNKLDRLILELHLPPVDAFAHLQYLIRSVNQLLSSHPRWNRATTPYVSPVDATVIFASAAQEWSWTLASLAERYAMSGAEIAQTLCASHLWTPWWWSPSAAQLLPKKKTGHPSPAVALPDDAVPSFVALVLEPWYKLTSVCVSEEPERTAEILEQQDASVRSKFSKIEIQSTSSLISAAFRVLLSGGTQGGSRQGNSSAYQPTTGSVLADVIWNRFVVPSRTRARSEQEVTESTPTVVCICRFLQFPASSAERELRFYAVSRVISGRLRVGQKLRGTCHQTDLSLRNRKMEVLIPGLFVAVSGMGAGSSLVPIDSVGEGAIVLIPGLDVPESVLTTYGVLYSPECTPAEYTPFRALEGRSVIRLGIEPFKPNKLPQLTEGLRLLQRAFPTLTLRVEETGERILTGTGELYLDVAMMFLRTYYAKIEIKVSDPSVCFREGVSQASTDFTTVSTYRDTNTFSFTVHPLSRELSAHLERGNHPQTQTQTPLTAEKGTTSSFQRAVLRCAEVAKWDTLTTHSVWALGPDRRWGANLLFNDILAPMEETDDEDPFPTTEAEVSLRRLNHTRDTIISGFIWATVEGPLCGEPLHGIGVRLTSAQLALDPAQRSIGHIQPCVRQAVHLAIMAAKPTLLEPVYEYEILAGIHEGRGVAYNVLTRRRGKVLSEKPQPCTPIVSIIAHVPAIELFGMETELRLLSKGDCFCQGIFSHWATVPGDPSQDVPLKVNEAAPIHKLARDCVQKTRRRRGMNPL